MSSLTRRWEAQCSNPVLGLVIYQFPFRVLLGILLGLSWLTGGCAARPDLLKLKQEVKHEKQQRIERQEVLRKDADDTREQLQQDRAELRAQLNQQHKGFMELQAALAETMREELRDASTALYAELSEVRALAAKLRVTLSTVREVELGGVIGRTEEIQRSVESLPLQLDKVVGEMHEGDTLLRQLLREESGYVREVLAGHTTDINTLQASLHDVEEVTAAESKTLDDFGRVLGKRISELEKHREWVETALGQLGDDLAVQVTTQVRQQDDRIQILAAQVERMQGWVEIRTQELGEQDAADRALTTLRLEELRKSLAGFKGALASLGEQLSAQLVEEGSQQGNRVQALSVQVQRMQNWVETRTKELAEQDATDMAMTAHRFDELRKSFASFEVALSNIGERLSAQLVEEGGQRDDRLQALAVQVQRMKGWAEIETQILKENQAEDRIATADQLEKLRGSLTGFENTIVLLGEGVAVQIGEQAAQQESLAAQMQVAQSELTQFIDQLRARVDQLRARVEQSTLAQQKVPGNE